MIMRGSTELDISGENEASVARVEGVKPEG